MFIRTPYNYDMYQASIDSGLRCLDISKAQQNQKEESDINTIVRNFGLTGKLPDNIRIPQYGDFTNISDYHSALNAVIFAEGEFMKLPAGIRARFQNDAGAFVDFCSNPANQEELNKMGLGPKTEVPTKGGVPPTVEGTPPGTTQEPPKKG